MPEARINLDNHATTRVDPLVIEAMQPWWEAGANAHSTQHASGRAAERTVEHARDQIAAAIRCEPREIIFTSGATEADNLAIRGVVGASAGVPHVVTNAAEHRAVLDPVRRLMREGIRGTILPLDAVGSVRIEDVSGSLTPETRLVSVMLANNEVGTINDVTVLGELCRSNGVLVHSDGAQALGKIPIDLSTLPVDLLSLSAHKLHGPQGVGALFVRRGESRIPLKPLLEGGGHESGLRSGTLPVALIVGFGEAVRLACERLEEEATQMAMLRDRLWSTLEAVSGIRRNGPPPAGRLPNNLNVSFEGIDGDALLVRVDQMGLNVSSGAACSSSNPEPSHVLRAMGLSEALARASLRFGLSRFTTEDEVDRAASIVSDAVESLLDRPVEDEAPAQGGTP